MRFLGIYKRLIRMTVETIYEENERLQMHYRWMLKFLFALAIITGFVNFLEGRDRFLLHLGLLSLFYFVCYWLVYLLKDRGVLYAKILLALNMIAVTIHFVMVDHGDGVPTIWIAVFPGLAIFLFGRNMGIITSLISLVAADITFIILYNGMTVGGLTTVEFVIRITLIYGFMLVVAFLSETIRSITVNELRDSKRRLEYFYSSSYSNLQDKIGNAQRARHDLRHHFTYVYSLLQNDRIDEAKEYVAKYAKTLSEQESLVYCENFVANSFFTYYGQRAKENSIPYDVKVVFPNEMPISNEDLVALIGNLLENAIEASKFGQSQSESFEPAIKVRNIFMDSMLVLSIENTSYQIAEVDDEEHYMSTKHEGQGIGLESVRAVADRYNGLLKIDQRNGKFTVKVSLFFE